MPSLTQTKELEKLAKEKERLRKEYKDKIGSCDQKLFDIQEKRVKEEEAYKHYLEELSRPKS